MNNSSQANSLSVSMRIYSVLLAAYPKKFREDYETQLVQVFRDSFRDAYHRHGMPGVIDLWLHTFADLLVSAFNERIMERSQIMFSPKVILWGGVASMICGLFWIMAGFATDGSVYVGLGLVLGLGGLAGLYSRQAGQGGRLGLAGFALGIIGTLLGFAALLSWGPISDASVSLARNPTLFALPFLMLSLGLVVLGVGIVLLGAAPLPEKAMHRWRGLPLGSALLNILAGITIWLVYYLPQSQGLDPWKQWYLIGGDAVYIGQVLWRPLTILLGIGWIGLGILLAAEANPQVAQTPKASAEAR